jgi:hypothetical protein
MTTMEYVIVMENKKVTNYPHVTHYTIHVLKYYLRLKVNYLQSFPPKHIFNYPTMDRY